MDILAQNKKKYNKINLLCLCIHAHCKCTGRRVFFKKLEWNPDFSILRTNFNISLSTVRVAVTTNTNLSMINR